MDGDRSISLKDLELSRRTTLAGGAAALGATFALSVQPVSAQTMIVTDTAGITAEEVKVPAAGGSMPAYVAFPAAKPGPFPMVIVVQEIFGVHAHIADLCRRLAKQGYYAIAPELYFRQGDPKGYTEVPKLIAEVVSKVPDAQVMGDLDAVVAYAKGGGKADAGKLAITGFCWGGRITWLYAAHNKDVDAAVAWYGRLVGDSTAMTPKHPVDIAKDLNAPVLGLYGGKDTGIPLESVEKMKAALKAAGTPAATKSTFEVYPEAPHAFNADYRPSYRKQEAEDGWNLMLAWFRANGVG